MKVYFVGAGAGDVELLTLKAHKLLTNCTCCIWAGSLINPDIVKIVPESATLYDSAGMNLEEIIKTMQKHLEKGEDVIRLHTGDPSIYSATGEQMDELDKLGIEYEVVPGISSFQAGAAALKAELTCPEISQVITIARVAGRTPVPEMQKLENLAKTRATLCLFLSISLADKISEILTPYYGEDCPVAVVYKAAWPEEKVFKGTLRDLNNIIKDNNITRTALIFIGETIKRPVKNKSLLYDKGFAHGYRNNEYYS